MEDNVGVVVAKFGGSSLSEATQFQKVKHIISLDNRRLFIVPSAPGKRNSKDEKVTDMLLKCHELNEKGEDIADVFNKIRERFTSIASDLKLKIDIHGVLNEIEVNIRSGASKMYCASRGEYVNGMLLADYLGYNFFDPAGSILFSDDGNFDSERTNRTVAEKLCSLENAVIPGFYGSKDNGEIQTFSRGGSDISGAIVARALCAEVYENWTDVSGFLMADPRIVENPLEIRELTYRELRELSYMGATVLHEDAIFPVNKAGISTNIRNTNYPEHPGTIIRHVMRTEEAIPKKHVITGIAGKQGFDVITIEKSMMNSEVGFGMRVLQALYEFGISFEHLPTGIDSICVVVDHKNFDLYRNSVIKRIYELVQPDSVNVSENMAIIATVGRGMVRNPGTASRLFTALSEAKINIRMIDQGSSELSILVGINDEDFTKAVKAIYNAFVK
ncbi:MAG: aspartate kinase [Christensenellaceae bacterium]|nr:aspartate kinase [Christensenellaceae bacterium]